MVIQKQTCKNIFDKFTKNKYIHEASLFIENMNGSFSYSQEYGGKGIDTPFLIASITKLYTTTCIFILKDQGKLSLDDPITTFFPENLLRHLHIYKGKDYTNKLTIAHLLCQTSGLPDDFEEGRDPTRKRIIQEDIYYRFSDILTMTKERKPHFAPEEGNRAHYANVNFYLLGKVIEKITKQALYESFKQYIFDPLTLENTYLSNDETAAVPTLYYKDQIIHRPKFMASSQASGGAVSTARDLMIFIKAFFGGKLFHKSNFKQNEVNHKLQFAMFPIHYGAGFMRISLGGFSTLFMGKGELIGHSGSSGSFAFYHPESDLFFSGDVNQITNPALPVRLAMRLAMKARPMKG